MKFGLIFLAFAALAAQAETVALRDGERMEFRVSWGIFSHAGDIEVTAHDEMKNGLSQTVVRTATSTRGFIRRLYPFDGEAVSQFDATGGRLLAAQAVTSAGRKKTRASIVFDKATPSARYVDHLKPERSATLPVPPGDPMDLVTSLIQTRCWDIQPGQTQAALVLFDNQFYDLTIRAERIETIDTPWGRRSALLLTPRMETDPKGMFKKGGEIRVWISTDENRLPLRFEVKTKVGAATAVLTNYRPPVSPSESAL